MTRMNTKTTKTILTMTNIAAAQAQTPPQTLAQANPEEVPEQVLVTGSLIRGTAAVGVMEPAVTVPAWFYASSGLQPKMPGRRLRRGSSEWSSGS